MANLTWKRRLGHFWPTRAKGRKIILLYHSLGNSLWAMPVKQFREQIKWLSDYSQVVSLTELMNSQTKDDLQVAITFDDGYQSLHHEAAAILADKKLSATVYLNTGWIGETTLSRKKSVAALGHYPDEMFLTWEEVKDLNAAHWIIGSHGVNHHNFSRIDENIILQELLESKKEIENQLNKSCLHFTYPFGQYSSTVKQIAKKVGYQYAAAARHGQLEKNSDVFALPRINIDQNYSLNDFQQILKGKWDYLNLIHKFKGL